mmetsp:Transcript_40554/g.106512  ORF Transcript_40554/g.106512 Transcript_40554/m.106512 type:complete len:241 (+) Transcript_40554:448-1170(+)
MLDGSIKFRFGQFPRAVLIDLFKQLPQLLQIGELLQLQRLGHFLLVVSGRRESIFNDDGSDEIHGYEAGEGDKQHEIRCRPRSFSHDGSHHESPRIERHYLKQGEHGIIHVPKQILNSIVVNKSRVTGDDLGGKNAKHVQNTDDDHVGPQQRPPGIQETTDEHPHLLERRQHTHGTGQAHEPHCPQDLQLPQVVAGRAREQGLQHPGGHHARQPDQQRVREVPGVQHPSPPEAVHAHAPL